MGEGKQLWIIKRKEICMTQLCIFEMNLLPARSSKYKIVLSIHCDRENLLQLLARGE